MTVFTGTIQKIEIGSSTVDITNARFIRWRRIHTITPRNLPSTKIPVGYLQSHSYVEGEFGLVSEYDSEFSSYIDDDGDNTVISSFKVTVLEHDGTTTFWTFYNAIISHVEKAIEEDSESVFVYHFLAYYVSRDQYEDL